MMIAKFSGRCQLCHGDILVGAPINWAKGFGATHIAGMCSVQPIIATPVVALPPTVSVKADDIVVFLTAAKARGLRAPKARFLAPGGGELRLSLAGGSTRYPGAVQVKVDGEWVGRIGADGVLTNGLVNRAGFVAALTAIATDPADAAKKYGALMGHCAFCGLTLTDAGSVEVGYGPICAAHWGLPHHPKGTPALTAGL